MSAGKYVLFVAGMVVVVPVAIVVCGVVVFAALVGDWFMELATGVPRWKGSEV